jgi:hypothetical protein
MRRMLDACSEPTHVDLPMWARRLVAAHLGSAVDPDAIARLP